MPSYQIFIPKTDSFLPNLKSNNYTLTILNS